jgi:hypothetical protein
MTWVGASLVIFLAAVRAGLAAGPASLGNAAQPVGEPVLDPPTLRCLGVYWIVRGDENKNAKVELHYRRARTGSGATDGAAWRQGPPLFRVEKGAHHPEGRPSRLEAPEDAWLFAGSVVLLDPDTPYELRLRLSDPDGGKAEQRLSSRTIAEPVAPAPLRQYHVVPEQGGTPSSGSNTLLGAKTAPAGGPFLTPQRRLLRGNPTRPSGGTGSRSDPFRGLAAAQARARPGDRFLLHAGTYEGTFKVESSGEPGRPIVWSGAGDGEAILDGQGSTAQRPGRVVDATGIHDVWFEKLTLRRGDHALVAHNSSRLVVRRCHMSGVEFGITFTHNDSDQTNGFFISDNVIEGPSTWPRTKGIEDARGIQATGTGHVVCYNRIRGFADAIDTFPSQRCAAIDFHNNEIHEMTDDGIEMDYSERNTRCFFNRLTNVFQGISVQPIYGGPVYIFRNALYNVGLETFKMHNSPSGALMIHNTSVKKGIPLLLWTPAPVHNSVYRNNLFIGKTGSFAYDTTAPMIDCDFDYDGFGGGPWENFLRWNKVRYRTLEEVRQKAPVYRHVVQVDSGGVFASGLQPPDDENRVFNYGRVDLRLAAATNAADTGEVLPGFNDGHKGRAPDLGAYELGEPLPHYGPRPER